MSRTRSTVVRLIWIACFAWVCVPGRAAAQGWTDTATLNEGRMFHSATLLDDGSVLVAGGQTEEHSGQVLSSAERFDPRSETWTETGPMMPGYTMHSATRLGDGRVLLVGFSGAQVFDPQSNTFAPVTPPREPRTQHVAFALDDGRVLITSGAAHPRVRASVEIYDGTLDTWTYAPALHEARWNAAWTRLPDGRVLVAGGESFTNEGTNALQTAEVFDPQTEQWSLIAPLQEPRTALRIAALANGEVVAVGGDTGWTETSYEVYDPARDRWRAAMPMVSIGPKQIRATTLRSGLVLFTSGERNLETSAQLYLPWSQRFITMPSTPGCGLGSSATLLEDGRVLVTGGKVGTGVSRKALVLALAALGEPCGEDRACETGVCELGDAGTGVCVSSPALPMHDLDGGIANGDGGVGNPDGGLSDGGDKIDADDSGCGCRMRAPNSSASVASLLVFAWLLRRRRKTAA